MKLLTSKTGTGLDQFGQTVEWSEYTYLDERREPCCARVNSQHIDWHSFLAIRQRMNGLIAQRQ